MAKQKTQKAFKKPFDGPDFLEISKSALKKEIGESGIESLENTGKLKTEKAIYKIEK